MFYVLLLFFEMAARRCSSFAQSIFSAKERSFAQSFQIGSAGRKSAPSQENSRIVKQKLEDELTDWKLEDELTD